MSEDLLFNINAFAWVTANILVLYVAIVLSVFVVGYYALFDPRATTAGKFIFRFALSLIGIVGLVFISLFIDPIMERKWWNYEGDNEPWRPLVRLGVYAYVAYTVTALAVLLVLRKWFPQKLTTAPDRDLVKLRILK